MFAAIIIILAMALADIAKLRAIIFKPFNKTIVYVFVAILLSLLILGARHVENPFIVVGQFATLAYFIYFLIAVPFGTFSENILGEIYIATSRAGNYLLDLSTGENFKPFNFKTKCLKSALHVLVPSQSTPCCNRCPGTGMTGHVCSFCGEKFPEWFRCLHCNFEAPVGNTCLCPRFDPDSGKPGSKRRRPSSDDEIYDLKTDTSKPNTERDIKKPKPDRDGHIEQPKPKPSSNKFSPNFIPFFNKKVILLLCIASIPFIVLKIQSKLLLVIYNLHYLFVVMGYITI